MKFKRKGLKKIASVISMILLAVMITSEVISPLTIYADEQEMEQTDEQPAQESAVQESAVQETADQETVDQEAADQEAAEVQTDTGENPKVSPRSAGAIWTILQDNAVVGKTFDLLDGVSAVSSPDNSAALIRVQGITCDDSGYTWNGSDTTITPGAIAEYTVVYEAIDANDGITVLDTAARTVAAVPQITITVPDEVSATVGVDFDMMKGVSAQDDAGNSYTVEIQSVTATGETYTWNGTDTKFKATVDGSVYAITYIVRSLSDGSEIYTDKTVNIYVMPRSGGIGAVLDGDYAYLTGDLLADSATDSNFAIRTGTAPFDDAAGDGNDVSNLDNTVRSFDLVTYTVDLKSHVYSDSAYDHYLEGTINFEFIIPEDSTRAIFSEGSMGWLKTKKDIEYTITTKTINGSECQILSGSFTWEPTAENPSAIGESSRTLNIAVQVLAMTQGEVLQPQFTFWLEGNEIPDGVVTGNAAVCSAHDRIEPITITPPDIEISSYPRYNVQIKAGNSSVTQYKGTFDFNTGNSLAANQGIGEVTGRLMSYGVTIQMYGKSSSHGLKGMELPSGPITFDLDVSAVYTGDSGTTTAGASTYMPLLWSYEGQNGSSTQLDGREIPSGSLPCAVSAAPENKGSGVNRCYDGGTWKAIQTGSTITVTVSDYTIDLNKIPHCNYGDNLANYLYYNPTQIGGYWDIQKASFSAGEFWILQPFYEVDGTDSKYIVDELGESGTFKTTLSDRNLQAATVTRRNYPIAADNSNQGDQTDDRIPQLIYVSQPGTYTQVLLYKKYQNRGSEHESSSLTYGCNANGKDWSNIGGKLSLEGVGGYTANDAENRQVAGNYLIKFDDEAIELEGTWGKYNGGYAYSQMDVNVLYAAKKNDPKNGWNGDMEMKTATEEDMIYFSSLADLESHEYVCVAVLAESRGISPVTTLMKTGAIIDGHVKNDPDLIGNVYMLTMSSKVWTVAGLQDEVAAYTGKNVAQLTDDDYDNYAKHAFPSRSEDNPAYSDPYIEWNATNTDGLKTYQKAHYDESGYTGGHTGSYQYGDSLYIAGYTTGITKHLEQKTNGTEKTGYDLDANQRIADFVLYPSVKLEAAVNNPEDSENEYTTTIYVKDVLPSGLSYVPGSAYIGGTYTQNGSAGGTQGTITDGIQQEPATTKDPTTGETTLIWTFTGQTVGEEMPAIHFAVEIGTPSNEATDVTNNQALTNTAYIWGEDDVRDFTLENGNKSAKGLLVSKNIAISISKYATSMFVEVDEPIEYILNIGNNGDNALTDIVALESLPYNGDAGKSRISGTIKLESFKLDPTKTDLSQIQVFYTVQESERGKTSADYTAAEIRGDDGSIWVPVTVNADGTIPKLDGLEPVAVAMVGTIPGQKILNATVKLEVEGGQPGDYLANRLTRDEMESWGRSYIVARRIEGVTWVDLNKDGERQDTEPRLANVKVVLYKDGTYYADTLSGSDGSYTFEKLPAGEYTVEFVSSAALDLSGFTASPENAADVSEIRNSNGVPTYAGDGSLEKTVISGIILPAKEKMVNYLYESKYHDSGFSKSTAYQLTAQKELTGRSQQADEFTFEVRDEDGTLVTTGKNQDDGTIVFADDLSFEYEGTYTYVISEADGSRPAVGYDESEFTIVLDVKYNTTVQELEVVNVTYKKTSGDGETSETDGVVFENTYTPAPAAYEPEITKHITGDNPAAETFNFVLKGVSIDDDTDQMPVMPSGSQDGEKTISLTGAGTESFGTITYDKAGVYTYQITEIPGNSIHYGYDKSIYTLVVTVSDDPDTGVLSIDENMTTINGETEGTIEFTNEYDEKSIFYPLEGTKILSGRSLKDQEFLFEVRDEEGQLVTSARNDKAGKITFAKDLRFTQAGTYTYMITEVDEGAKKIVYDSHNFKAVITVTADTDNRELEITAVSYYKVSKDGEEELSEGIQFVNTYDKSIDPDSDEDLNSDIKISKATNKKNVKPNEEITYTITVEHVGDNKPVTDITVTDYVPDNTTFVSADKGGKYQVKNQKELVTWNIDQLSQGEQVKLTFTVKVKECVSGTVIRNTAYAAYDDKKVSSNEVTNPVQLSAAAAKPDLRKSNSVRTGDGSLPVLPGIIMLASAMISVILIFRKKKA